MVNPIVYLMGAFELSTTLGKTYIRNGLCCVYGMPWSLRMKRNKVFLHSCKRPESLMRKHQDRFCSLYKGPKKFYIPKKTLNAHTYANMFTYKILLYKHIIVCGHIVFQRCLRKRNIYRLKFMVLWNSGKLLWALRLRSWRLFHLTRVKQRSPPKTPRVLVSPRRKQNPSVAGCLPIFRSAVLKSLRLFHGRQNLLRTKLDWNLP